MAETIPRFTNKIVLGTVQFGLDYGISNTSGQTPREEVKNILQNARRFGIDTLDTAYGYGTSEKVLGEFLKGFDFKVISKFPRPQSGKKTESYVRESLSLLRIKDLYGFMAHDGQSLIDEPVLWKELVRLKEQGIVRKIGYSLYTTAQLQKLLNLGCKPDIVQIPFNVFDRRFEKEFSLLKSIGTEIHVRSVFLQGLFFIDPERLEDHFNRVKPMLKTIHKIYSDNQAVAAGLLRFCVENPLIDKIVIGVNTSAQLMANLESLDRSLPEIDFDEFSITDESVILPYNWPKSKI